MSTFNSVTLIGRLGSDPEQRRTNSSKLIVKFSVATHQGWGKNRKTVWHRITTFDKTAENCLSNLAKGSLVHVQGRLEYNEDRNGKTWTNIVAQLVTFLGRSEDKPKGNGREASSGEKRQERKQEPKQRRLDGAGGFVDDDNDIPF